MISKHTFIRYRICHCIFSRWIENIALKIKTMDLTEIYKLKTSLKRSSNCLSIISHSHITYDEEMFILAAKIDAKKIHQAE